ncbi:MAG: hypothetical protein HWD61_06345 [Parachlamydiaceae bacterium]|nr:MAG: hypothetical protein HWD61_06345 [Parachlamydiaceae bacterium]
MMNDMAVLMPQSIQDELNALIKIWGEDWKNISADKHSEDRITHQIGFDPRGCYSSS